MMEHNPSLVLDCIDEANKLIQKCKMNTEIKHFYQLVNSCVYIQFYEIVLGRTVPDIISFSSSTEDEIHNCQCVIDSLSLDILNFSLIHITGESIVLGHPTSIKNLLEIFNFLIDMKVKKNQKTKIIHEESSSRKSEDTFDSFSSVIAVETRIKFKKPVRKKSSKETGTTPLKQVLSEASIDKPEAIPPITVADILKSHPNTSNLLHRSSKIKSLDYRDIYTTKKSTVLKSKHQETAEVIGTPPHDDKCEFQRRSSKHSVFQSKVLKENNAPSDISRTAMQFGVVPKMPQLQLEKETKEEGEFIPRDLFPPPVPYLEPHLRSCTRNYYEINPVKYLIKRKQVSTRIKRAVGLTSPLRNKNYKDAENGPPMSSKLSDQKKKKSLLKPKGVKSQPKVKSSAVIEQNPKNLNCHHKVLQQKHADSCQLESPEDSEKLMCKVRYHLRDAKIRSARLKKQWIAVNKKSQTVKKHQTQEIIKLSKKLKNLKMQIEEMQKLYNQQCSLLAFRR